MATLIWLEIGPGHWLGAEVGLSLLSFSPPLMDDGYVPKEKRWKLPFLSYKTHSNVPDTSAAPYLSKQSHGAITTSLYESGVCMHREGLVVDIYGH
jgi:hypothetical protein